MNRLSREEFYDERHIYPHMTEKVKCYGCEKYFPKEEITTYHATPYGFPMYIDLCPKCLEEAIEAGV